MRVLKSAFDDDGKGTVVLAVDEDEDLAHLFHIVASGDVIRGQTFRKVTVGAKLAAERRLLTLAVAIETIEFDFKAAIPSLRLKGRTTEPNEYVQVGQYHCLEVERGHSYTLAKTAWDSQHHARLAAAADATAGCDLGAILFREGSGCLSAALCVVKPTACVTLQRFERSIPHKRRCGGAVRDAKTAEFVLDVLTAASRSLDVAALRCLVIAAPQALLQEISGAAKAAAHPLWSHEGKVVLVDSPTGAISDLPAILAEPDVARHVDATRTALQAAALGELLRRLAVDEERVEYGFDAVTACVAAGVVDSLLICDSFLTPLDPAVRRRYVTLCDSVRELGGDVVVFAATHPTGQRLAGMSGIAALLRQSSHDAVSALAADTDAATALAAAEYGY